MKKVSFNVFDGFKCVAGKCKHNCCIGWEIDIDKRSLEKYKKVKPPFSQKLKDGIDEDNGCFKLDKGRRCAFLNDDNLCEIYVNCGKNYLCQVCRDHPRFRNYFSGRIEEGVGISCEKACEMLVKFDGEIKETVTEDKRKTKKTTDFENKVLNKRSAIYQIINKKDSVSLKVEKVLEYANIKLESILNNLDIAKTMQSMEKLNETLYQKCSKTEFNVSFNDVEKFNKPFSNLLWYFITRHLSNAGDDLDIKSRIVFSVLSVYIIFAIFLSGEQTEENLIDVAREYSAEIEYDDENVFNFLDEIERVIVRSNNG